MDQMTPVHSRLFHLQPFGIATSDIESLTSYLIRLAFAHSIHPYTLIKHEVLPLLRMPNKAGDSLVFNQRLSATWWHQHSQWLNGLSDTSQRWATVLNHLTLRSDLHFLTLLPWAGVLSNRALIRWHLAWCPVCYQEQRNVAEVIYTPLLWSIHAVTVCPKHRISLITECPHNGCHRSIPAISASSAVGYCPYCRGWLGHFHRNSVNQLPAREIEAQLWISNYVGELLASAATLNDVPDIRVVSQGIANHIAEKLEGNAKAFARELGMNHKTIYELRDGRQVPQLGTLLKISTALDTTPLALLLGQRGQPSTLTDPLTLNVPIAKPAKGYQHFSKSEVRVQLRSIVQENQVPPPSMAFVAKQIGLDQSFLVKHFPRECTTISRRFQRFIASEKSRLEAVQCDAVRQTMCSLHEQGLYPSHKRLTKLLGGALRNPRAREARRELLIELGYKKKE